MGRFTFSLLFFFGYLVLGYLFIVYFLPYLLPFVLAGLLAVVLEPGVRFLEKHRVPRPLASFLALLLMISFFLAVAAFLVTKLVLELANLYRALPLYYDDAARLMEKTLQSVGSFSASLPLPLRNLVEGQLERVYHVLAGWVQVVLDAFKGIPGTVGILGVTFLATYFLSKDKATITAFFLNLFPPEWQKKVVQAKEDVLAATFGFIRAELALVLFTLVGATAGLLALGVQYALTLGLLAGLLDLLPVLGPALIFVPWAIYCFLFGDIVFGLKLSLLYLALAGLRQFSEARVVGQGIGVHPLATLFFLYLGLKTFGAGGFLVGPLAAIILKAVVKSGLIPLGPPRSPGGPAGRVEA